MKRFQPDPSRYEIERDRGEGLSATVCKAIRIDPRENVRQIVALKFPKDGTKIADLRHEFEALSRVGSKHCARALAWESAGSQNVLVLEWIDGPTLFELAAAHKLSPDMQNEIVAQIYQGLLDLSAVGLHHGDLHPNNVMIGSDGVVRLIDFASRGCAEGEFQFGVPAFLAPELKSGDRAPSFTTDLFALGVLKRGLSIGFRHLPTSAPVELTGFCAQDPEKRASGVSNLDRISHQSTLRDAVAEFQALKALSRTQVLLSPLVPESRAVLEPKFAPKFAVGLMSALFFMALSISVQAEAPLLKPVSDAKLTVRTLQWAEISLNGKKIGYSPVELSKLRPGQHRLSWSSAFGAGSLVLELKSGEVKRIDERALRSQSKP